MKLCLPRHPKGKRAGGTYKQWCSARSVVFEKFSFSLESATVSYLRSLQFAIFGRRLLPFLVVAVWLFFFFFPFGSVFLSNCHYLPNLFHVIIVRCLFSEFLRTKCDEIYIYIYIWNFLKHRIESHMVMIWECQAWFFFQSLRGKKKRKPRTFFSGQWTRCRNIKENVYWIKVIFFFFDHIIASCGVYD